MALPDDVRAHCAAVAERGEHVRIVPKAIAPYASALGVARTTPRALTPAYTLQLNAINFGSGWFPTLRKPPGLSGFRTIEARLRARGPWTRDELRALDPPAVAETFGQDPDDELMALYARALNELGEHVNQVTWSPDSAVAIAERLAALPMWHDPGSSSARRSPPLRSRRTRRTS